MENIKLIIFDLDGTLWHSAPNIARLYDEFAQKDPLAGGRHITEPMIMAELGKVIPQIAADLFPDLDQTYREDLVNRICAEETIVFRNDPPMLYPEVQEGIRSLAKRYRIAIVSNCESGYIETFLSISGLSDVISGHLCPGDTGIGKAGNIVRIAEQLEIPLSDAVYVGDTTGDYDATKEAGIRFIHAAYGYGSVPEAEQSVASFSDLCDLLS